MTLPELTAHIDEAVNPAGGLPLITGPALNGLLHTLATELHTDPAPLPEADLSSHSPTAVPSVQAVANALAASEQHIADAITSAAVRTVYPDAQAALNGAGAGGTANIYAMSYGSATSGAVTTLTGVTVPAVDMIVNLYGIRADTQDANTDYLTFRGGARHVVNAFDTTLNTLATRAGTRGAGWTINALDKATQYDVTINRLNVNVNGCFTHVFYLTAPGTFKYSGNITVALNTTPQTPGIGNYRRWVVNLRQGTFYGQGSIVAHGNDQSLFPTAQPDWNTVIFDGGTNTSITWEGNVTVYEDAWIQLGNGATLTLRNGILDARNRATAASPLFHHNAGTGNTVVLENYALLCAPTAEAIQADTVILRGNTVVVGTINATTIIDERPAAAGAAAADVVHLAGAETITGPKTFAGDVFIGNGQDSSGLKIRKPSGDGYQRLLDVTNVDRPNSINFGAVGEGGDLRYHGTTHRWVPNGGSPLAMLLDEQANLTVTGQARATAFVGDGSQLTNLPASQSFSGSTLQLGGHEALRYDAATNALVQGGGPDNLDAYAYANNFVWTGNGTGQRMVLDTGSNLSLKGQVQAAAFVGDGAQLTGLPAAERPANKGVANGYAPLDATAKVPAANLPPYPVGVSLDQVNILAGRFIVSSGGAVRTYTNLKATTFNAGDTVSLPYNGYIVSYNEAIKFTNVNIIGNNCTLGIDNGIGWVFTNCQVRNLVLFGTQGNPSGTLGDESSSLINSTFTDCTVKNVSIYAVPGFVNGNYATAVPSTVVFDNVNAGSGATYHGPITLKAYGTTTVVPYGVYSSYYADGATLQDYRPRTTSLNQLLLSAQVPGNANSALQLPHGLTAGNIVSITALAYGGTTGLYVPPGFTLQPNLEYYCHLNGANVVVTTTANSAALYNGAIQLCVTFK